MVSALDEKGQVLQGFERDKCILQNADAIDVALKWDGKDTAALSGKKIRLRFYLRAASIYSVREEAQP
jgi:hypothetical protein